MSEECKQVQKKIGPVFERLFKKFGPKITKDYSKHAHHVGSCFGKIFSHRDKYRMLQWAFNESMYFTKLRLLRNTSRFVVDVRL